MISVHSPEFSWEKKRPVVEKAAQRFDLKQPIYMDNDFAFWKGLGNRYWPSFYLVDRNGYLRMRKVGEMHKGTARAAEFERMVQTLLDEPGPKS